MRGEKTYLGCFMLSWCRGVSVTGSSSDSVEESDASESSRFPRRRERGIGLRQLLKALHCQVVGAPVAHLEPCCGSASSAEPVAVKS